MRYKFLIEYMVTWEGFTVSTSRMYSAIMYYHKKYLTERDKLILAQRIKEESRVFCPTRVVGYTLLASTRRHV